MWDQTGKTFTASSDVLQDVGHAAPGVHGEGAHLALKRLAKIIMTRRGRFFFGQDNIDKEDDDLKIISTRRMMVWCQWTGRVPPCRSHGLQHLGQGAPGMDKVRQKHEASPKD